MPSNLDVNINGAATFIYISLCKLSSLNSHSMQDLFHKYHYFILDVCFQLNAYIKYYENSLFIYYYYILIYYGCHCFCVIDIGQYTVVERDQYYCEYCIVYFIYIYILHIYSYIYTFVFFCFFFLLRFEENNINL